MLHPELEVLDKVTKNRQSKSMPSLRVVIVITAILLFIGAAALWILNIEHKIQGDWTSVLPVVFTILAVLFALFQWLFQLPPIENESRLSSDAVLIDAHSDPSYEEIIVEGKQLINFFDSAAKKRSKKIDFKLQNKGTGSGFMWQFVMEVLQTEIDLTPVLDFKIDVDDDALVIVAINNGWGIALDCQIQISEDSLNRLYFDSHRKYKGSISDGKSVKAFSLMTTQDLLDKSEIANEKFKSPNLFPFLSSTLRGPHETAYGIKLGTITIEWNCQDANNIAHKGLKQILLYNDYTGGVVLTHEGFLKINLPIKPSDFNLRQRMVLHIEYPSDTTYKTIVDPTKGPHEENYPISRKISAGDIDRFQIEISSVMSSRQQIRFKFYIDQATVLSSAIFEIDIWNPRNPEKSLSSDAFEDEMQLLYYEKVIRRFHNNGNAYNNIGLILYALDQFKEALIFFDQVIRLSSIDANAYYNKGLTLYALKQYQEALIAFDQAIRFSPNDADAYYNKGLVLFALKEYEEALIAFDQAIWLSPSDVDIYYNKGLTLYALERYSETLSIFKRTVQLAPNDANAYCAKGRTLFALKRYKEALADYKQGVILDTNKVTTAYKEYQNADETYKFIIDLSSDDSTFVYNWGLELFNQRQFDKAITVFERAIQLSPNNADAYFNMGQAFYALPDYEEALACYNQALQLQSNNPNFYFKKGHVLKRLGMLKEAELEYRKAAQLSRKSQQ